MSISSELACDMYDVLVSDEKTPVLEAVAACVTLLSYIAHRAGYTPEEMGRVITKVMTDTPVKLARMNVRGQA
jgi:hypothetical protein